MHPIPNRAEGVDGTAKCRTIHRAATIVTTSMTGVSISSAILVPNLGTTHSDSKHEARSEYEREIEHASFQNRHNILLSGLPSKEKQGHRPNGDALWPPE